jgi:hypothetical protein
MKSENRRITDLPKKHFIIFFSVFVYKTLFECFILRLNPFQLINHKIKTKIRIILINLRSTFNVILRLIHFRCSEEQVTWVSLA